LAIALEFINVIVRKSAIEAKYPGGVDGFVRQDFANYLEDEHILRVGFMSTSEATRFVEELLGAGLRHSDDAASDLAVITWDTAPSWLTVGECEGRGACWLSGMPTGKLVDLDHGIMLRCHKFGAVEDIVDLLRRCGIKVRENMPTGDAETSLLKCERGDAQIEIEIFQDAVDGRPYGIVGRRNLTRRTSIAVDVELMRDLAFTIDRTEG
jgi:hypothetical protein